jgi:hypothetical protein
MPGSALLSGSPPQHESRLPAGRDELLYLGEPCAQHIRDPLRRSISQADLHDLWRVATKECPRQKVIVFRDDEKTLGLCKFPNMLVIVARESLSRT